MQSLAQTPDSEKVEQLGFEFEDREDRTKRSGRAGHARPARAHRRAERSGTYGQLTLGLDQRPGTGPYAEATVRGQERVELLLRRHLGPRVIVALTSNRSTMISYNRRRNVLYVRIHAIFADAPEAILQAVAAFIARGSATSRQGRLIDDWIELHRHRVRKVDPADLVLQPIGEVHDLEASFERLNREHFGGTIQAKITWSKAARNQRRSSIRMGSYCDEQRLIRIHPALDQAFVPAYFVESVIFHEMLHELHGVEERKDGRRCIHSPEFLEDERRYPLHEDSRRWEHKHLHKLLRY